ncbi:MAG: GDSL-type esterase/lipase family protein [Bacteroidota bacterium]|nr:GDSL-type esterase/lipase family protein [Bacteroidota bacterium]
MIRYLYLIVLFITLSCVPLSKYRESPEVKSWEPDIEKFEQLDISKYYPDDAIMFAGSSSIRLWSTINKDMLPYNVIQRGYGGAKLSDFVVYADRIIYPHICQAIVIFIGNDITGSNDDKSPLEVSKLFRKTLYTIRRKFPDTPVFWISITPTAARWGVWPEIKEANEMIRGICEKHRNTYFIDTEKYFLNSSGLPKEDLFVADKLHLNPDGYKIWAGIIKGELNKVLMKK